ncbi:MAG: EamA family transporter [Planctomycetota bacterium]|nr:EamA family transporter [Planctomycetota bacterium]
MGRSTANLLGVLALLGWCMNVGVTRHVASGHVFGLPGLSYAVAGIALIFFDCFRGKSLPWKCDAAPKFWTIGGGAFVLFCVLFVFALSWSDDATVVLSLGLVNYCWPVLILLFMPFFTNCHVRPLFGIVLCLIGICCAMLWGMSMEKMLRGMSENWPAFLIMAAAAVAWALYSNLAGRWAGNSSGTGWFELVSGLILLVVWFFEGGPLGFTANMVAPFLLHALAVNATCYLLWDYGIRYGDLSLMGTLANFLPLGSILFGAWYLGGEPTPGLWLGGILVSLGAIVSRRGGPNKKDAA